MSNNNLDGTIPADIIDLTHLKLFHLVNEPNLTGTIPVPPAGVTWYVLDNNNLNGSIPPGLPNSITILSFQQNALTGTIPDLPDNLTLLSLGDNDLTGPIPSDLPATLTVLNLRNNDLSGCFPASLSELCDNTVNLIGNPDLPDGGSAAAFSDFCTNGGGSDDDGDTYCQGPAPYGDDCNDDEAAANPGLDEVCGDGIDNNCDGQVDEDCCAPPDAVCQTFTAELDGTGNVTISPSDVDGGSTYECGLQSMTLSETDFDCSDVGPNTVTLTVTDENNDSDNCMATVTVEDNNPDSDTDGIG